MREALDISSTLSSVPVVPVSLPTLLPSTVLVSLSAGLPLSYAPSPLSITAVLFVSLLILIFATLSAPPSAD